MIALAGMTGCMGRAGVMGGYGMGGMGMGG